MARRLVPLVHKLASVEDDRRPAAAHPAKMRRHQRRARAGAAGQRDAAAPLPHPHAQPVLREHVDKLDIRFLGEDRMDFQRRAVLGQIKALHRLIQQDDPVRVARAHRRHLKRAPEHRDGRAPHHARAQQTGYLLAVDLRRAHVHADTAHRAVLHCQLQHLDTSARFQRDAGFVRQPAVVDVLADAAAGVAAHIALGAVRIEHAHAEVRHIGGADEHQPVRAHAEVPVADARGERAGVVHMLLKRVDIDVVVADALHFGKLHRFRLPSVCSLSHNSC